MVAGAGALGCVDGHGCWAGLLGGVAGLLGDADSENGIASRPFVVHAGEDDLGMI